MDTQALGQALMAGGQGVQNYAGALFKEQTDAANRAYRLALQQSHEAFTAEQNQNRNDLIRSGQRLAHQDRQAAQQATADYRGSELKLHQQSNETQAKNVNSEIGHRKAMEGIEAARAEAGSDKPTTKLSGLRTLLSEDEKAATDIQKKMDKLKVRDVYIDKNEYDRLNQQLTAINNRISDYREQIVNVAKLATLPAGTPNPTTQTNPPAKTANGAPPFPVPPDYQNKVWTSPDGNKWHSTDGKTWEPFNG